MANYRTSFQMEIDVQFSDPDAAISYLKSKEWADYFFKFDDLGDAAEHLANAFHATSDQWDGKNKRFSKFIEGFGEFFCDSSDGYKYKFLDKSENLGNITISYEMELEPMYTLALEAD